MITRDNQLSEAVSGAADWDTTMNANLGILERGYHTTAAAAQAINTGYVCWMDSGGFFHPYDPNSTSIFPDAIAPFSPSSGESQLFLLNGIVRSLYLAFVAGKEYYASATTPGLLVTTPNGSPVGHGLSDGGFYFRPRTAINSLIPTGGNSGDVLVKTNSTNFQTQWENPSSLPGGAGGGGTGFLVGNTSVGSHRWWGLFNNFPVHASNMTPVIAELQLRPTSGGASFGFTTASAYASSNAGAGFNPMMAIDGIASTFFSGADNTLQSFWVDVGSGKATNVAQIAISTRSDSFFAQGFFNFDFCYSDDGLKWFQVCHIQGIAFTAAAQQQVWNIV